MREPYIYESDGTNGRPFSVLPDDELQTIANGFIAARPMPNDPDGDVDFARRYAALLLKERGR